MGEWGPAPFENDEALDFVADLRRGKGAQELSKAFSRIIAPPHFEGPQFHEAQRAIAAAEVVAAVYGAGGPGLPEDVQAWLNEHSSQVEIATLELARRAIALIQAEALNLKEVWRDSETATRWTKSVDDVRHRLDQVNAAL